MSKRMYVYSIITKEGYDPDDTFDSAERAIELAMKGTEVAVLDALSLEFYGDIN